MRTFILQRLLAFPPTLIGISIIVFLALRLIPGDAITAQIGTSALLTETQIKALREYYGLDQPLVVQYGRWLTNALQLNLGISIRNARPVLELILDRFPLTFELTILSLVIGLLIGIPIGIVTAIKRGTPIDVLGQIVALIGLALPNFWLGTLIILVLSLVFHVLPNAGDTASFVEDPLKNLSQMIFPSFTLGFGFATAIARMTRSAMLEELRQDYARTARSKGLRERVVVVKHCLHNALIPIVTLVGIQTGYLLGGTIVVEQVFALPGVGRLLLNAIAQRDYALVQGTIMFIAFNFLVVNLATDIIYGVLNPRIQPAEGR